MSPGLELHLPRINNRVLAFRTFVGEAFLGHPAIPVSVGNHLITMSFTRLIKKAVIKTQF